MSCSILSGMVVTLHGIDHNAPAQAYDFHFPDAYQPAKPRQSVRQRMQFRCDWTEVFSMSDPACRCKAGATTITENPVQTQCGDRCS